MRNMYIFDMLFGYINCLYIKKNVKFGMFFYLELGFVVYVNV